MTSRRVWVSLLALVAGTACTIGGTDFTGRACQSAADCPIGLTCAKSPSGIGYTCERVDNPIFSSGNLDAGTVYYCSEVKPVLDAYCIACHSVPPAAGAPRSFRLDVYATDGGLPGAASQAENIARRAYVLRDMPPSGVLAPNTAERTTLAAWSASGASYCADAGY
jgi:hypothetical protein